MRSGGLAPCILNAANEIAVEAFLNHKIKFTSIPEVVEHVLNHVQNDKATSIEHVLEIDAVARQVAGRYIQQIRG